MPAAKNAFEQYLHYSRVLTPEDLREFFEDGDFSVVCVTRLVVDDMDLTEEEQAAVREADARLAAAFDDETLEHYAEYFPETSVRAWWGRK